MSLDSIQVKVHNRLFLFNPGYILDVLLQALRSLSLRSAWRRSDLNRSQNLYFTFLVTEEWDNTLYSHTKLVWFSVDCSCTENGSTLFTTSCSHPMKYIDYFPHSKFCILAALVLPRPSYGTQHSKLWIIVLRVIHLPNPLPTNIFPSRSLLFCQMIDVRLGSRATEFSV